MTSLVYRQAELEEIITLRYAVLCTGRPWREAQFVGDGDALTHHFGAFRAVAGAGLIGEAAANVEGARPLVNVGCVSYMMTEYEGEPAWQLRGMATRPDLAGQGVGRALVRAAQEVLLSRSPVRLFWCKARTPAIPFYERLGWRVVSEEFVIEHYGPHRKMMLRISGNTIS